jgi:16S rRNA (guanine(527)-N(7))-methyltransferase RsmG
MSFYFEDALKYFSDLSIEKYNAVSVFADLLLQWNGKLALLGNVNKLPSYLFEALEFANFINSQNDKIENIVDFGTGNGLPAIVVAICLDIPIILTEKVFKKICFLKKVVSDLNLKTITIYHGDIKHLRINNSDTVFISKAFACLDSTFDFIENVSRETINGSQRGFFLKGQKVFSEIQEAEKKWSFFYKIHDSIIGEDQCILETKLNGKKNSNL